MTQQHPITPPPELVEQWAHLPADWNTVAFLIAQWGADAELEACCEWLEEETPEPYINALRAARRPSLKPPSLKEQALETLKYPKDFWSEAEVDTIRRALEQLPDNE
jgi:hypothetical protein